MTHEVKEDQPVTARKGSLLRTAQAVLWSFFGVRKKSDYAADAEQLNPLHVIVMGLIGAALFVIALLVVVNLVVK